jgi:hypothetical protein
VRIVAEKCTQPRPPLFVCGGTFTAPLQSPCDHPLLMTFLDCVDSRRKTALIDSVTCEYAEVSLQVCDAVQYCVESAVASSTTLMSLCHTCMLQKRRIWWYRGTVLNCAGNEKNKQAREAAQTLRSDPLFRSPPKKRGRKSAAHAAQRDQSVALRQSVTTRA